MPRLLIICALIAAVANAQVSETITVARILLDVRVTEIGGEPYLDLTKNDFTVTIGGKPAGVESASWIPETAAARAIAGLDEDTPAPAPLDPEMPRGRLIVVFVQTDFSRASERVVGAMNFLASAKEMIESLEPDDRVAVFSFDSHLRFRLDFMDDKTRAAEAIQDALTISNPPTPPVVPNPSLRRRLDPEQMKKATSSEEALILIGNALRPIPGPKTLLLLGWGLGTYSRGQVVMSGKYAIARRVLESARVTIFALDTTYADYHSLEVGLGKAAKDTGGFYAKTHQNPKLAVEKLQRTLSGHYELEVRRPEGLKPGVHEVVVRVKRRGATVLAPGSFTDRP
jgi:VWFA-related protein